MIKGRLRQEMSTVEEVLSATNGGYDIFYHYLGKVGRCMPRPWGKRETKSSWGVYPDLSQGVWFWKDHATEETGNALHFVQRYFSLTFIESIDKICYDFGLGGKYINAKPVVITWDKPDIERDYMDINFSYKPFEKQHHLFWNAAEVTEEHCRRMDCYAVKDLAINKRRINIREGEAVFAYYCPEEDAVKLYFPERSKDKKFRNNVSYHHLWNFENLTDCENLIVQKSVKDLIVTTLITPCVTATQAEAVKIFNEEVVGKINNISRTPWIWYGSDWDGVKKCKEITDTNGWRYINTPKDLLPEVNDTYGFVKKFGIRQLEEFMKLKGLI